MKSRKDRNRARFLRFERLEDRELFSVSKGLDAASFDALQASYPGFDYSGVSASDVLVLDATSGIDAANLREAINLARSRAGADVVAIKTPEEGATIAFASASDAFSISDSSPVAVVALGGKLTIDAGGKSRVFTVGKTSYLELGGLVLKNGSATNGGAILSQGNLLLDGVWLSSNVATSDGGAIYNSGELTVVNSIVSGNRSGGNGGGVYSTGTYVNDDSVTEQLFINATITGNVASGYGGGVYFKGTDENFDVFAEANFQNTIVVQNRSASTTCDVNIYNSIFYNKFEFDGQTFEFEEPVAALIDGTNNLSTFAYWLSSFDEEDPDFVDTNKRYNESIPLFERDYDFNARVEGDYSLYNSSVSQAINSGSTALPTYRDGNLLAQDFAGSARKKGGAVDVGAYEADSNSLDLRTYDGAVSSATQIVAGERLTLSDVRVANVGDSNVDSLVLRFFASLDGTLESSDIALGSATLNSLLPGEERSFATGPLATDRLTPGASYLLMWRVETTGDANSANNVGALSTPISIFTEETSPTTVPFALESYSIQTGSSLYLALAPDFVPPSNVAYRFDYGAGVYVEGSPNAWLDPKALPSTPGETAIRVKVLDLDANKVVASGSVPLTVSKVPPTLTIDSETLMDGNAIRLKFVANSPIGAPAIASWRIEWSDESVDSYDALGNELTVAHYFSSGVPTVGAIATITLTDADGFSASYSINANILAARRAVGSIPAETPTSRSVKDGAGGETSNPAAFGTGVDERTEPTVAWVPDAALDLDPLKKKRRRA
ncbi:MAG: hypothetical protein IJM30_08840 [Thermoguttaceae bacterium]|nr:hypothetical protein [Thermoguttaceae bacterium]